MLPLLKTLVLPRFNVTLGSEIVNYRYELDVKSFRFCFLLEVNRVFLENRICRRSRKVAQNCRAEMHRHRHQKGSREDCIERLPPVYSLAHGALGALGFFPSGRPLQQELLLLFVINIQSHWAVLPHFKGFSG